jgi:hypothetical protein
MPIGQTIPVGQAVVTVESVIHVSHHVVHAGNADNRSVLVDAQRRMIVSFAK